MRRRARRGLLQLETWHSGQLKEWQAGAERRRPLLASSGLSVASPRGAPAAAASRQAGSMCSRAGRGCSPCALVATPGCRSGQAWLQVMPGQQPRGLAGGHRRSTPHPSLGCCSGQAATHQPAEAPLQRGPTLGVCRTATRARPSWSPRTPTRWRPCRCTWPARWSLATRMTSSCARTGRLPDAPPHAGQAAPHQRTGMARCHLLACSSRLLLSAHTQARSHAAAAAG